MAFIWSKKRIDWYLDASHYCDFHKQLAQIIAPYLRLQDRVCDFGCGLGMLDIQLAHAVAHINCVDIDPSVLRHLQWEAGRAGVHNLSTLCTDTSTASVECDVALMVFFGYPPQLMFDCMNQASRLLIRVANVHPGGAIPQPSNPSRKRETVQDIALILDSAGYSYELMQATFEFGQPLRSRNDAGEFVRCSSPAITGQALETFLDTSLTETGRKDFPLYLPGKKDLGIFIVETR